MTDNTKGGSSWETKAAKRAKTRTINRRSSNTHRSKEISRINSQKADRKDHRRVRSITNQLRRIN
jgi:hypothetical protein